MQPPQDSLSAPFVDSATALSTADGNADKPVLLKQPKKTKQLETPPVKAVDNFFYSSHSADLVPKSRIVDKDSWIIPLLLLAFFLAGIINTFFFRSSRQLLLSLFKRDGLRKLIDEENILLRRTLLLCLLQYLIILPVFVYQVTNYFNLTNALLPYVPAYAQLLLVCAGTLGLKVLVINALGFLFDCSKEARNYSLSILVLCAVLGLIYIPISLAIKLSVPTISSWFLLTGLGLTAFAYLISLLIGLSNGLRSIVLSKFHLILYFCTLEILPVILIIKAVKNSV
jgi:hypothetical protein